MNGRQFWAHRFIYELLVGPIPPEKPHVLHNCPGGDNPSCVRPDHLWVGTNDDNIRDMIAKGRQARGERSGTAKLTEAAVREIRRLHAEEGLGAITIARRLNFSVGCVNGILTGRNWAWLREAVA